MGVRVRVGREWESEDEQRRSWVVIVSYYLSFFFFPRDYDTRSPFEMPIYVIFHPIIKETPLQLSSSLNVNYLVVLMHLTS